MAAMLVDLLTGARDTEEVHAATARLTPTEWESLLTLAVHTKTVGLLARRMSDVPPLPDEVADNLKAARRSIEGFNLGVLGGTCKACRILGTAGIDVLAIKGALQSHAVFGDWSTRKSVDVDLLVRPDSYRPAAAALIDAGYIALVPDDSPWWHDHLGESPYAMPGSDLVVDLHWTLQQPGGPYPRDPAQFFDTAQARTFGSVTVAVPDPAHSALITAISYGKAALSQAPWLSHVQELHTIWNAATRTERRSLTDLARRQGLDRLLDDALRKGAILFDTIDRSDGDAPARRHDTILSAVGEGDHRSFDRTRLSWRWSPGGPATRIARFAGTVNRLARSRSALRGFERANERAERAAAAAAR